MSARGFTPISTVHSREKYDGGTIGRRSHVNVLATPAAATSLIGVRHYSWTELEITGGIVNLSPSLWHFGHLTKLYLRNNQLVSLPADVAHLSNLVLLDVSSNKLHSLPPELGDIVSLKELLLSNNHLRLLPFELGKLFQLQKLELKGNPLPQNVISLLNDSNGIQKLLADLLDQVNISAIPLPQRPWIPLNQPDNNRPHAQFMVMCYNILCDKYCTRQLYGYCPPWALSWDYRKKMILDEVQQYNADIVSLQEVETEQFYSYFLPELKKNGYAGVFSAKSRARTMTEQERKHVDGCAIFYKTSKFHAIKDHLVEFNQVAIEAAEGSHDMINRVMTKDNIGLALLLETTEAVWANGVSLDSVAKKQLVLIATCHVHWDPEYCDVKLIQTMMFMHRLQNIIKEAQTSLLPPSSSSSDCNQIPVILCGDLNSLPESGVVEFLTSGRVNANHRDFKEIGYDDCLCKLSFTSDAKDIYTHGFRLAQAYGREILPFTNYTFDFRGIIDYIFYGRDFMRPLGVLGPPDWSWFEENHVHGCPHPQIPSDHVPLLVQFEMSSRGPTIGRR